MKNVVETVRAFLQKDHFSDEAWRARGINPSDAAVSLKLTTLLNQSTDNFTAAIEANASPDKLKATLLKGLNTFSQDYFDTEEKEYICELFYELAQMANLNMSFELNSFLCGPALAEIYMKQKDRNPVEIVEYSCTKCAAVLRSHIMQKQAGIPAGWQIVRCEACDELNLLEFGNDIKEIRFENYKWETTLRADIHTKDQVLEIFYKMRNSNNSEP
jgi:hypothetical protein